MYSNVPNMLINIKTYHFLNILLYSTITYAFEVTRIYSISMVRRCTLPSLSNSEFRHWQLETGHGGSIYTSETGRSYKSGLIVFSRELVLRHLPAYHWVCCHKSVIIHVGLFLLDVQFLGSEAMERLPHCQPLITHLENVCFWVSQPWAGLF